MGAAENCPSPGARCGDGAPAVSAGPVPHRAARELAKAVLRAARDAKCKLAQAPTGNCKTMATVFPMLKTCADTLDKVQLLCAKTASRQAALGALDRPPLGSAGLAVAHAGVGGARPGVRASGQRPAMAIPVPLARGFTIACRRRAPRRWSGTPWTALPCAPQRWRMGSSPVS